MITPARGAPSLPLLILLACPVADCLHGSPTVAAEGTEFAGTVLAVDASAGKLTIKKEGSGTRFTFVISENTRFEGGLARLADVKKGDHLTVHYRSSGGQYLAMTVSPAH